jgi:type VI secretion system protein ImpL
VVPPASADNRFIAPVNQPYIQGLQGLEQAVKQLAANPLSANDPTAANSVTTAALAADQAAETLRNSFNPDSTGDMGKVSFNRLEDPITSALALAKAAPAGAANGAGKAFCGLAGGVLAKFPFNPKGPDATPEEVATIFAPGQALTQLAASVSKLVTLQGNRYIGNPGLAVNQPFLNFFSAAEQVQAGLFPAGATQPTLNFTLTEVKAQGVPDAVLNIDGRQLTSAGQPTPFQWFSQPGSKITLISDQSQWTGPWSIFRFGFDGYANPHTSSGHLEYRFPGQVSRVVQFDVSGPGAPLLNPAVMGQLQHCVAAVAKP